ncbi:peptidase M23 [Marispirochaeta aestuarii]|uniref:Peptidase M23 n=1 Tax=Marispirochaeta aestuarii TaxID=1963862 RepID=A0A1Y1S2P8_9SPIO|nr:M23 family metallopeptidase [Marispirochaeta aestuarii]ORC38262.1 peptidase M23 [Marispirochaeta aestuarii]
MSPANQYKKVENKLFLAVGTLFFRLFSAVGRSFNSIIAIGKQRFTVMFIPHSEKKIFNFKISVFAMIFFAALLSGVVTFFFYYGTHYSGISSLLKDRSINLEGTQANLELIRDEIASLKKSSRVFEASLNEALSTLGLQDRGTGQPTADGDLSSFLGMEEQQEGVMRELSDLQSMGALFLDSAKSLESISKLLSAQGDLLYDLPSIWPVEGGIGRITNPFGPAEHPFTKQWYLHKGIDIAYGYGIPIIAAANGKVVERKYEPLGFGNYLLIRHKYGFYSKYAHMGRVFVREGDSITQGQRIGTMDSTGLSTGPHLHYEVRIGSQVVDPARFLNIK